ncbi:MAG: glycosyltransferase family 4 protein [Clostridia bacterium]|nr:glycosyltransferase family 4 protein [Clostridia bacterium]
MKILLYTGNINVVEKSGVGRAIKQQLKFLEDNKIPFTVNIKDSYDIIHLNTVFPDSFIMSVIAKIKGKKIVYHAHSTKEDFENSFCGSNFLAPLFKKWIMLCYNMGDLIITPTEYSKKLLYEYRLRKPIVTISNGIDLDFYKRDGEKGRLFREKYGFRKQDKIIMSVGLHIKRKGILDFVELAKILPEYQFVWFGYTDPKIIPKEVRNAVGIKLPNLHFPGYISREELRDAYNGSDLFLFLTYEETEGIVLLEALAMKIPVLVRDIDIYKNWLSDGRDVYKGSGILDFYNKIREIINGDLPDITEAGYETVKKKDIKTCGKRLIFQYIKLAANKKTL